MENIFTLYDTYERGNITFEQDPDMGVIVSFNKNQNFFGKILQKIDYSNNSDYSIEISLDIDREAQNIQKLIYFLSLNDNQDMSNNDFFHLDNNKIIVGCNCVGGINEHSIYINHYNDDSDIDSLNILSFKMNLNNINDSIILSSKHSDFIINFIKSHVRQLSK